jgi:mRNA-degrading endonuclease RelE of RelBE toxin-antitoxin system
MYNIELTFEAMEDLAALRKFDQVRIVTEMENQLAHEPTTTTRHRKRLRPNKLAEWELRIDNFRIFYDVLAADAVVKVIAVGEKIGSDLFIHGERYEL